MGSFLTAGFQTDTVKTADGDLNISFIGHGTLMFKFKGMVIHVDPFSRLTDYGKLPKADLVLITHHHGDHLDLKALEAIVTDKTKVVITKDCKEKYAAGIVMANGDKKEIKGLKIEAVPAYNLVHKRKSGEPFHPKGSGNGYVVTFGDKRVYIAGDTENTPEMKQLKDIDVAFLPMNLPYTMSEEMVADAAAAFKPKILYIYHFFPGKADFKKLETLFKDIKGVDLRYHIPEKK
jgi:L-ascorbate metabolism protein UlaG (beta-lactamase superfamily)